MDSDVMNWDDAYRGMLLSKARRHGTSANRSPN